MMTYWKNCILPSHFLLRHSNCFSGTVSKGIKSKTRGGDTLQNDEVHLILRKVHLELGSLRIKCELS